MSQPMSRLCRAAAANTFRFSFALLLWAGVASAQSNAPDYAEQLPRVAPLSPEEALKSFAVQPPFKIELVASEPLVNDPVAVAFDERLRMFVVEMRDYSEDKAGHLGQVRLLEDADGDGRFDSATVFADNLSWPTAIACWDGGVFVGAAPDMWYLRDTDGDGRADERRVVFTGFGKHNVQGLLNSFHWGLEGRIHGSASTCGGMITRPDRPDLPGVNVNGRDFAFDPRTLEFQATSGGAQHGMSFDDLGRKFVSSNSDHLQQVMYDEHRLARNPRLSAPGPRISIAADGPQAEVFRRSPVERWREIRTELRVAGKVPGPIEGGGRAAGYFTGATGVTIYRGDAWPAEFHGLAIIGDVGSNIVHRKRLEPNGLEFIGRRLDEGAELVASTDIWFRPAQFANAPDGSLYILDVYREVIEHPDSLPPEIKRHLDLTSGNDRGRIYRLVPEGFQQPKVIRPGDLSTIELVALLEHANGWHRDTASRLLFERQDRAAIPALEALVTNSSSPLGRMHALHALSGLNALSDATLITAIADADPQVAAHAVRLCEGRAVTDQLVAAIGEAIRRGDSELDYQIAFALADMPPEHRAPWAVELARRYPEDRWQRLAVQSSLAEGAGQVAARIVRDGGAVPMPFLESLVDQIGRGDQSQDRDAFLTTLNEASPAMQAKLSRVVDRYCAGVVAKKGDPLRLASVQDEALKSLLESHLAQSRQLASDANATPHDRAAALVGLYWLTWPDVESLVTESLTSRAPTEIQVAALELISKLDDPAAAQQILASWPELGPQARAAALETLCSRSDYALAMLDAVEKEEWDARQLDPARVTMLLKHTDDAVRKRAQALLSASKPSSRAEVLEKYREALALSGDVERGRATFKKTCATCHRLEDVGYELGPNLAAMKARGAEAIFVNVLDPNREANPQYINYVVTTHDGRSLTGIMAAETATGVTLRRGEGAEDNVLRAEIDEIAATGLSLMPEGLEQQLTPQALADVIAYLMQTK
jgi:putative membrane-bound dehydrogenase-like protein